MFSLSSFGQSFDQNLAIYGNVRYITPKIPLIWYTGDTLKSLSWDISVRMVDQINVDEEINQVNNRIYSRESEFSFNLKFDF